jgi:hypothetical protein
VGGRNAGLKCALCGKGEARYVLIEFMFSSDLFTPVCETCLEELKRQIDDRVLERMSLESLTFEKLIEVANKRWQLALECFKMLGRLSREREERG